MQISNTIPIVIVSQKATVFSLEYSLNIFFAIIPESLFVIIPIVLL
jgi:hypothetical protein